MSILGKYPPAVVWRNTEPEDFTCVVGDYCLRVERMDKKYWWWAVYYNDNEIAFDEPKASTEKKAKQLAKTSYRRHWKELQRESARDIILAKNLPPPTPIHDVSIDTVTNNVCAYYGLSVDDVLSKSREAHLIVARQMIMYICNKIVVPYFTTSQIGIELGGLIHATVIHGRKEVIKDLEEKEEKRAELDAIILKIINSEKQKEPTQVEKNGGDF